MADIAYKKQAQKIVPVPAADVVAGERVVVLVKNADGTEKQTLYDESVPANHKIVAADLRTSLVLNLTDV